MKFIRWETSESWLQSEMINKVALFALVGALIGAATLLMRIAGAWLFGVEEYGNTNLFVSLAYQAAGGAIGGVVAAASGLSLPLSLMYSLIFCRYFEEVGPLFSSKPSQYIYFLLLIVALVILLRSFIFCMKSIFKIDFGNETFMSIAITSAIGLFLLALLHYLFLNDLWRVFIANIA